ncbi:hypothetical protein [Planobispora takensis]|uniref:Uncharacterized protein n=1 Tax=Planobispora takensis TaxID=1367882 RepID=A0A8J3T0M9_9ACTN|nr:hypothetical protein [Planobispora takensis]GII02862.1 hypothetical protein Pta02_48700 [Planobispora takensis]
MSNDLEADLRAALGHAAERAPRAPGALSAHVVARSRRRTRGRALVAAAAAVLVAGGIGVAVRGAGDDPASPAVDPARTASAEVTQSAPSPSQEAAELPEPVEKVWPDAVWKIPAELPGGRKFHPLSFIDDRTLLLETWESFEKADAIYAYELDGGRTRKITDIRTPKGVFASGHTVGDGLVVWQTIDEGDGDETKGTRVTRFWSVPLGGGTPREIGTDRPVRGRGDELAVTGGRLAFSLHEGGVFTVPLGGGTVEPVPGAERHHILRWPWVGTPGEYTPDTETSFEELLNAETGERNTAVVRPGERFVRCGVTTCAGSRPDGTAFHRMRDGSRERDLPGGVAFTGLAADRFETVNLPMPPGGEYLHDLVTDKSGDLGIRPDAKGESISVQPGLGDGRLVSYPLGDEYVIIDLARIAADSPPGPS